MKCHYEGTGCLEGRCMGTKEIDPCIGYERCSMFKPDTTTNADRIRAMSDEDMAAEMNCPYMKDIYDECKFGWHTPTQSCFECKLEWLRQPVKDGED